MSAATRHAPQYRGSVVVPIDVGHCFEDNLILACPTNVKGDAHAARASLVLAAGLVSLMLAGSVFAQQAGQPFRIGILSDLSSVYSDIGGTGNVEATKMAIEEFGGSMFGTPIGLLTADPQNKPDTAASIVRKWYENEGVDMIIDMPTSATALAGMELSKQFEKIMIVTDAASSDITGKSCSPNTAHWTYDTYANAHTVGGAIVKNGGDSWFFITADLWEDSGAMHPRDQQGDSPCTGSGHKAEACRT